MGKNEVINILSSHPDILNQYQKGTGLRSTGSFLVVGGIVVFVGGMVVMATGIGTSTDYYGYSYVTYNSNYFLGWGVAVVGELMFDGGIACRIVGKSKIRRAIYNYNNTISNSSYEPGVINYQLGFLDNGKIGLKLTF